MSDSVDASKKPEDSDFQQQRLKAWQPLLTPGWVIGTFVLIGIIFIPIGIAIVVSSAKVVEVEVRYDDHYVAAGQRYPTTCVTSPPGCQGDIFGNNCTIPNIDYDISYTSSHPSVVNVANCAVPIKVQVPKDMTAPVYMYYKLTNFYQNHRRYVKSRSDTQLSNANSQDTSTCDPWKQGASGKEVYPCGLIAGSFFVDRFDVAVTNPARPGGGMSLGKWWEEQTPQSPWIKEGIAWASDKSTKFQPDWFKYQSSLYDHNGILGVKLPPVNDEDFIVWMRTAGLPTFKKLYRKINIDLLEGDTLTINALNYYPVDAFSGQKSIVFSTTSWLGGKNSFLGWAYIIVGIICVVLAIVFAIKHYFSPRPLGDMSHFNMAK